MFLIVSDNRLALLIAHPCFISSITEIFIYMMFNVLLKHRPHSGEGGILPEKLGRGVRTDSQNPYPIYDQNLAIFPTLFMTWPKI